jgi:Fe-S oxidoreductase
MKQREDLILRKINKMRIEDIADPNSQEFDDIQVLNVDNSTFMRITPDIFKKAANKLFEVENNWPFLQLLNHTYNYCRKCNNCSDRCPIFIESGGKEQYRPSYRAEVLRRMLVGKLEINPTSLRRLAELAYRCNICRRCAQTCMIGADNGLIAREIRKLFSQEWGIAPDALHKNGTMKHLKRGSSTGMNPDGFKHMVAYIESQIPEYFGSPLKIPVDVEGAEYLFVNNAGEYISWPHNLLAYTILFALLEISWTLSSELMAYDAVNYGVWYDDFQFLRIAMKHAGNAASLKTKKVLIGECGHAHKCTIALIDRLPIGYKRESVLLLLEENVGKYRHLFNSVANPYPITLHDPCNISRMLGIYEPQRNILKQVVRDFREMVPNRADNYCCGGGSGLAIMRDAPIKKWRKEVAGAKKMKQILEVFAGVPHEKIKYVCAPCSNCKAQLRDLLEDNTQNIRYTGLAEVVCNALEGLKKPLLDGEL